MTHVPTTSPAPEPIHFRKARGKDRERLLALCAAYREADDQPQVPELVAAAIDAALEGDPLLQLYLIEWGEARESVGYLAITVGFSIEAGGRDAFVDELFVEAPMRGRGVGTAALEFAERACRALHVRRLCLEVERENPRAKALYERLGYRDHGRYLLSKPLAPDAHASESWA